MYTTKLFIIVLTPKSSQLNVVLFLTPNYLDCFNHQIKQSWKYCSIPLLSEWVCVLYIREVIPFTLDVKIQRACFDVNSHGTEGKSLSAES